MNVQARLKRQVLATLRDWIKRQGLSQAEAARLLGLRQQQVSEIMRLQSRNSIGWLLQTWHASGGLCSLEMYRANPRRDSFRARRRRAGQQ